MKLKCPNCGNKASKNDYLCPKCKVKFRPRSVTVISAIMLIFGLLKLSPALIIFSIGIYLMKQWARRWLIIGIIFQFLISLIFAGFDYRIFLTTEGMISGATMLFVLIPMAVFLLLNEEAIEAFEFYGGRI